jgi:1-acyl-sn-glycerol-3-phosphate acyltransferase
MIKIKRKESPKTKAVYTKYLGEDYDFEDQTYSLITSNHIGFFDVILVLYLYQPGFIAKKMVQDYPFFGSVAKGINCLFVDRESEAARKK